MYVYNGYAGGGALSVYSTTGPLVTGCELGDCTPEGPLVIDRERFDGQLQLSLEGSSGLSSVQLDAFAFYPQETVTLFVTRRSPAAGPSIFGCCDTIRSRPGVRTLASSPPRCRRAHASSSSTTGCR